MPKNAVRSISYIERVQNEDMRVMHPMERTGERGSGEFEHIGWGQAMDEIAERMEESKSKYGPTACSFYSFTGNQSKIVIWGAISRIRIHLSCATSCESGSVAQTLFYHATDTQFGFQGFKRDRLTKSTAIAELLCSLSYLRMQGYIAKQQRPIVVEDLRGLQRYLGGGGELR